MSETPIPDAPRADPARRVMRQLLGGAFWLTLIRFASVGLGVVISALLARALGPAEFGYFAFAISVATLLALPMTGGLPMLVLREIAAARAEGIPGRARGLAIWSRRLLAGAALALWLVSGLVYGGLSSLGLWPWGAQATMLAGLVVLLVPAMGALQLQRGLLSGHDKVALGGLGEQLFRPALMVVLLLLASPVLAQGSVAALGLQLGATVGALVLMAGVGAWALPPRSTAAPEIRHRDWLVALGPLTALTATTIVSNHTDILMLGVLRPAEEVGLYRIAAQVTAVGMIAMQILRALSAPRIAAAHARGDTAELRAQLVLSGRLMAGASLGFVIVLLAFGRPLLALIFGPDYDAAFGICVILSLGTLFSAACGLSGVALQATRHADLVARSAVIAALVNVVLNLALIPLMGAPGAALATSIALVTLQARHWLAARRVLGLRTDGFQAS